MLKRIKPVILFVILCNLVIACESCFTTLPEPEQKGFGQYNDPIVFRVPALTGAVHRGLLSSAGGYREYYVVFDWEQREIVQFSYISDENTECYTTVGIYSPYSDAYYFGEKSGNRLLAVSKSDGSVRTAAYAPLPVMHIINKKVITKEGYIFVEGNVPDENGFPVGVFDTKTDDWIEIIYMPQPPDGYYSYDGERYVYFQDFDWHRLFRFDCSEHTLIQIDYKQDMGLYGFPHVFKDYIFIAYNTFESKADSIFRFNPATEENVQVEVPQLGGDYYFAYLFKYTNELYLYAKEPFSPDDTPWGGVLLKYNETQNAFNIHDDKSFNSLDWQMPLYIRDKYVIGIWPFFYEDDANFNRRFSQYKITMIDMEKKERVFEEIVYPY